MSHEVRTPLNGIIGFSQLLNDKAAEPRDIESYTENILSCSNQLLSIIDNILEISILEKNEVEVLKEPFLPNKLMANIVAEYMPAAESKKLNLTFETPDGSLCRPLNTNIHKLRRIIGNLIENAIKFSAQGNIKVGCHCLDDEVKIWVADEGIGILPANQAKIFDRFSQEGIEIAHAYGGLGLGLAIAREYTALLGGRIWVESQKDRGAVFFVTLPYDASTA